MSYDHLEQLREMRERKIDEAIKALPHSTPGDWWCDDGGELHNDAVGSVKLAKYVSGGNPAQRDANRKILAAARDLAIEVERLRNQPPICMTKDELVKFLKENPEYRVPEIPRPVRDFGPHTLTRLIVWNRFTKTGLDFKKTAKAIDAWIKEDNHV